MPFVNDFANSTGDWYYGYPFNGIRNATGVKSMPKNTGGCPRGQVPCPRISTSNYMEARKCFDPNTTYVQDPCR